MRTARFCGYGVSPTTQIRYPLDTLSPDTLSPRRNIGPVIPYPPPQPHKEHGTRDTLPPPCEQNDWQTPVKT